MTVNIIIGLAVAVAILAGAAWIAAYAAEKWSDVRNNWN